MKFLLPTIVMMNEFCIVLVDMERNGIKIDEEEVDKLDKEYQEEQVRLEARLQQLAQMAMGDTPINLNSPEQLSTLIYSRKVKDKNEWARIFGVGSEMRGSVKKKKRNTYYKRDMFNKLVQANTDVQYKTFASQCPACKGKGRLPKFKQDGTLSKQTSICKDCINGVRYTILTTPVGKKFVAGFKQIPQGSVDVTALGFRTDKEKLQELASHAEGEAKEFLQGMVRLNAISSYRATFLGGIRRAIRGNSIVHTSFMQCIAATGRLSSQNPNYHNQPRGATFPVRRVVVSRWPGGSIIEGDYSQLEFRVAAELSRDPQAIADILDGIDAHTRTSSIMTEAGQPTNRQDAKPHTFKPLYGGTTGTQAEQEYYRRFLQDWYPRIGEWHEELCSIAVSGEPIILPSGRAYMFPNAFRYPSGSVANGTQIKNYPVQGFATADIVPVAAIAVARAYWSHNVKSKLINEVHDSIVTDCYPGEEELIIKLKREAMLSVPKLLKERYNYDIIVPLDVELKIGPNWLEGEKVK